MKKTDGVFIRLNNKIRVSVAIAMAICVFLPCFILSSCSVPFSFPSISVNEDLLSRLPSNGVGMGNLQPPEGQKQYEIGSSEDLFYSVQDSLYSFSSEIYILIDDYSIFSRYWEELTVAGALHSAFQQGQVQIEYENRTPCNIRVNLSFNECGLFLKQYLSSDKPSYETNEQIMLDQLIREIRENIIREDMNDFQKVVAVHDYIVVNTQYIESENSDYLATAISVLKDGKGQCQGYSEAFAAIMIVLGVETRVISGKAFDSQMRFVPHAWNQVKIDGVWYHVDVTWDDPIPDTGGSALRTYMLRSDEFFETDHMWSDYFPRCAKDNPILG